MICQLWVPLLTAIVIDDNATVVLRCEEGHERVPWRVAEPCPWPSSPTTSYVIAHIYRRSIISPVCTFRTSWSDTITFRSDTKILLSGFRCHSWRTPFRSTSWRVMYCCGKVTLITALHWRTRHSPQLPPQSFVDYILLMRMLSP